MSYETIVMDVVDFCSMIMRREIFPKCVSECCAQKILTLLMGMHPRLGENSVLNLLLPDLLPVILQRVLPKSVWIALQFDLVKL